MAVRSTTSKLKPPPSSKARLMKAPAIAEMFRRLKDIDPDPRTELNYVNPYTLLVAVVCSAQMTDKGVNKATESLFRKVKTPQAMVKLGVDGLLPYLKTINFHRTKAANVIKLSQQLIGTFGGEVPNDMDKLQTLAGVGRKTANVIMNEVFRQPTLAVDTHVFRVANRTGLAPGPDVLTVELSLLKRVPKDYAVGAHHWLILHGRYTCVAIKPKCGQCPVFDLCLYPDKTLYAALPPKKEKAK